MTSILLRYAFRRLSALIGLVLLAFMSFMLVFSFLERIGDDNAPGTLQVLWDVALLIPGLLIKLLPPCCAIGSAVALARLDRRRELLAMRLHGITRARLARWLAAASIVWMAAYLLNSEIGLAASAEQIRENTVRSSGSFLDHQDDLWIRQDDKYIRIKNISAAGRLLHGITEFGAATGRLTEILDAQGAAHNENGWTLRSITMLKRDESGRWLTSRTDTMAWNTRLDPETVESFNLAPDSLSML
ncbi:MAG: LptF/LptG family permease, partial [Betaproteobacteria bacterium]|nr:LptF/LptG family permease [Betaproteobacteria bacterium]